MEYQKETPQQTISLAAESGEGLDDAAALPFRLARYDKARRRSLLMRDYARQTGGLKEAAKLHDCGSWLLFRDYYTAGKVRLHSAPFCKQHLLCPLCAIRRGAKSLKTYLERFEHLRQADTGFKLYLVTLTVKDGESLPERLNHLKSSVQKYLHQRRDYLRNPKGRKHVEFAKALGGVGSYEVKRGKNSGLWHPHVHMTWACYTKPDAAKLSQEWKALTGDSWVVDVTEFRDNQDPAEGFMEVFKYALKFSDMPLADNWDAYKVLSGRNMLFSFGTFYGVKVPDELTDEGLDDLPYVELFYRHTASGYQYLPREADRYGWGKARARQTYTSKQACTQTGRQADTQTDCRLGVSHEIQNRSAGGDSESVDGYLHDGTAGGGATAQAARAQARGRAGNDGGGAQSPPERARTAELAFYRQGAG